MRISNIKSERLSLLEYAFCFAIIWGSGTLFTTDYSLVLYAIVAIFVIMVAKREVIFQSVNKSIIFWIAVFFILSLLQNFLYSNGEGVDVVLKNYVVIFCVIIFALNKPFHNLSRLFFMVKTIVVISLISSFLYIFNVFGPGLPLTESVTTQSLHFHYLYTSGINTIGIGIPFRNGGIYWEPGMYQVYLTFALLFYLYYPEVKFRYVIALYLIFASISTFSVSAYIVMSAILGLYVIRNNSYVITKIIIALIVIVAFYYIYPFFNASLEAKQETGSYAARSSDLSLGLNVWLRHPIFGCGIVNEEYAKASLKIIGEARNDSNGMINLLINMGIVGFFIVVHYILSFAKWVKKTVSPHVLLGFIAWVVISSNTEPIVFHPFFEFLVGIGIAYSFNNRRRKEITPIVAE